MLFKRMAHAFLLGAGLSIVGTGCSAVDALVSSPAGRGANHTSPDRLVAIARVFESQGHLQRANVMYRQALKADPGNDYVKERLEFIASVNSGRSFTPSAQADTAIAAAKSKTSTRAAAAKPAGLAEQTQAEPIVARIEAFEPAADVQEALDSSSVMASLQPVESRIEPSPELSVNNPFAIAAAEETAEPLIQPAVVTEQREELNVVEVGWDLAAVETEAAPTMEIVPELSEETEIADTGATVDVDTISFDETDADAGRIEFASEWRATRPAVVTLDEVAEWMANPVENRDNLVRGLEHGEDMGVKALAATMLAECPVMDEEVNAALIAAFSDDSELLRLAAGDALIQRGAVNDYCVDELISLLASGEAEIRIQAAASLRNCAGTIWSARCVHGLAQMLDQSNTDVVVVAASTLGDFGADAQSCAADLQKLTANADARIVEASRNALNRIKTESTSR